MTEVSQSSASNLASQSFIASELTSLEIAPQHETNENLVSDGTGISQGVPFPSHGGFEQHVGSSIVSPTHQSPFQSFQGPASSKHSIDESSGEEPQKRQKTTNGDITETPAVSRPIPLPNSNNNFNTDLQGVSRNTASPATISVPAGAGSIPPASNQVCTNQNSTTFRRPSTGVGGALPFPIIFRINCTEVNPLKYHNCILYKKALSMGKANDSQHHIIGSDPVLDVREFLAEMGNPGYIVFRDISCAMLPEDLENVAMPIKRGPDESITIISKELKAALAANATYALPFVDTELGWSFKYPYIFISHHHDVLSGFAGSSLGDVTVQIFSMLEYLRASTGQFIKQVNVCSAAGKIARQHIPLYFVPNRLVITRRHEKSVAFVLSRLPMWDDEGKFFTLHCWGWKFENHCLERTNVMLRTGSFTDETIPHTELLVYPMEYSAPETQGSVKKRGQVFRMLAERGIFNAPSDGIGPVLAKYSGLDVHGGNTYSESRCIIDYEMYRRGNPTEDVLELEVASKLPLDKRETRKSFNTMTEEDDILLQPDVHAFMIDEKKWVKLWVDQLQPFDYSKTSFERLILPGNVKELIRSLLIVRAARKKDQRLELTGVTKQVTAGKGKGLKILLYGGSGVGKTFSAESIAEAAELPLYRIGNGRRETSAKNAEEILNNVLYLGKTWNCVLLLEDADFILQEESPGQEFNPIVSVFLRLFREYEGIIILTGSRVGTFNDVFKDVTHLAIHCPRPNLPARKQIWLNFIDGMTDEDERTKSDLAMHLSELAEKQLNAWQIRNVLTIARQVALQKEERLEWKHVEQSLEVAGSS